MSCTFGRNNGAGNRCDSVSVTQSGITVSTPVESWTGSNYAYQITFSGLSSGDTLSSVLCNQATATYDGLSSSASTKAAPVSQKLQRLENLRIALNAQSRSNFTTTCSTAAVDPGGFTCNVTTTSACNSADLWFQGSSATTGIYFGATQLTTSRNFGSYSGGSAATQPTWTFDIRNATASSATISAISCGSSILPANAPTTGTATASSFDYQRINNLTGSDGTTHGIIVTGTAPNQYTLDCSPATTTAATSSCTLTGPVGVAACNASSLNISKDSTIAIGTVSFTDGHATGSVTDNFYLVDGNALATASPFSTGRAPQGTTPAGMGNVWVGPIATTHVDLGGGVADSPNTISTNATGALAMGGGQVVDTSANHWADLGVFKRVDVVATNNAYSRGSGRTDCLAATCTYNEEMQNFANWYTYYRTRMAMMKSATTVAFSQLDSNYRVGYDNICSATGTTVRERVAQFVDTGGETTNQRSNWWTNLTGSQPSCATPLRAETAKIGRYYAGKLTASSDPLQYSCQQNFMFLVTDGYWNENEPSGTNLLGGDIGTLGNVDNNIATSPRPYYDGAQASTTCPGTGTARNANASSCRTLADITRYYYATDLRSSGTEVSVTTAANHGLTPGQKVTISGIASDPPTSTVCSPAKDLNATFNGDVVAYVMGPTTFRYVPIPTGATCPNGSLMNPTNNPGTYGKAAVAAVVGPPAVALIPAVAGGGKITVNGTDITFSSVNVTTGLYGNATNPAGVDVSTNNVMTGADDSNGHQHMNFYAMGLGIDGTLQYQSDYQTATTGDYADIVAGTRNWPAVANLDPTGVDDLWHAAVNGHGKYFSARNLPNVVAGLREALTKIGSRVGSASAAATSNLQPVSGDNFAYVGSYGTQDWVGDLQSRSIDLISGAVSSSTDCTPGATPGCQWSLQAKIDNMTWSARRIYVMPVGGVTNDPLRVFNWGNLTGGEQAWFNPSSLSQYTVLSVSNATDITGENLVDFLRGYRSLEQDGNVSHEQIWRNRAHVLGDIVNTQPIYMKAPTRNYSDGGYLDYKSSPTGVAATRKPVVFVSSQEGFMHAINANTPNAAVVGDTGAVTMGAATVQPGEELWAFIPTQAMQSMKVLADINYSTHHRYFVDGPITVADVNFGGGDTDWHTIVVGGHGAGGTAYFALDVTDPKNPKYLWEFTDVNLGYSFSNPVVTKLPNNDWVVLFTSGYNNNSGGGDGVGKLYAVDPKYGTIKTGFPLSTGTGSAGAPSNLGKISVWVDNAANNNMAKFIYAGDTNGDLWRFDFDPSAAGHSGASVFKLAHLTGPDGTARPITTKPEMTTAMTSSNDVVHLVMVGTGQYLETADLTNTDVQSFYAIKDTLGADNLTVGAGQQTYNSPRTAAVSGVPKFLRRKLIGTKADGNLIKYTDEFGQLVDGRMICPVGIHGGQPTVSAGGACVPGDDPTNPGTADATPTMDWGLYDGWMVDLPDSGERLNVDPKLNAGTIVFATNIPSASACTAAGSAFTNYLDYSTGLAVVGQTIASRKVSNALVVGLTVITLPSGETKVIVTRSDAKPDTYKVPIATGSSSVFQNKRSLWREFEAY
jgi:type IV pilus assembly protein PilY1